MARPKLSMKDAQKAVDAYRNNGLNVSAAARAMGTKRQTFQNRLQCAQEYYGLLADDEMNESNAPKIADYIAAKQRKIGVFKEKKSKGSWRKPSLINLPDRPFMFKLFGDPHMDSDGFNMEAFEKHWMEMDVDQGVYGACIGDWFNNWLRVLGHLWKEDNGRPDDAWLIFEHLMNERGSALLANCSGNHDDWSHGPADPIEMKMREHGVRHRIGAIRLILNAGVPYSVSMRHKWKGNSMYSAAHGLLRGAINGWNDDLLVGGHIHQDEQRQYVHADGKISQLCQISAFKEFDLYADIHGFMGPKISAAWNLVISPRREPTDPDRTKVFWDFEAAKDYLERERHAAR